jgi:thymidine kinase
MKTQIGIRIFLSAVPSSRRLKCGLLSVDEGQVFLDLLDSAALTDQRTTVIISGSTSTFSGNAFGHILDLASNCELVQNLSRIDRFGYISGLMSLHLTDSVSAKYKRI